MKKIVFIIAFLLLLPCPALAEVEIASDAGLIMEAQTGQILYEKAGSKMSDPAGIVKIMTALVALEKNNADDIVSVENTNEVYTLKEAIYVMLLTGSDNCANAIARLNTSEKDFVKFMNDKVKSIGIVNTKFDNPSGAPGGEQYTTAYDIAVITREALNNPVFSEIMNSKSYTIETTNKIINSNVAMLAKGQSHYEYATGGTVCQISGGNYNMVSIAKKGTVDLICVVLDSPDKQNADSKKLFEDIFNNYYKTTIDNSFFNIPTSKSIGSFGKRGKITFSLPGEAVIMLPNEITVDMLQIESDVKTKYRQDKSYAANLTITAEGLKTVSIPLVSTEEKAVSGLNILYIILLIILIPVIVILAIAAYYIIDAERKRRKRRQTKFKRTLGVKKDL